jgi:glycosyltransferase involved in cell wall biosynthesis
MRLTVLSVSYSLGIVSQRTAGGAEQVLLSIDHHLSHHGHRSIVVAPAGSQPAGLLIATPPPAGLLDEAAKFRAREAHAHAIVKALNSIPIDIIHYHGLDFFSCFHATKVPSVVTLHLPLAWYPPAALSLKPPEAQLVCVSKSQRESTGSNLDAGIILNGVAIEPAPHTARKSNYLLTIGRICPEKGVHFAIEVARRVEIPLYIAGEVAGYPEHRAYFEEMIRPHLSQKIRFLGPVSGRNKHALLAGARALLIPSMVLETSSLSAMEALACATPVVAFRRGALMEIVEHGKTGFLVDSVEQMAEAVLAIDQIDPAQCHEAASTRFSAQRMYEQYLELYLAMVKSGHEHTRNPDRLLRRETTGQPSHRAA